PTSVDDPGHRQARRVYAVPRDRWDRALPYGPSVFLVLQGGAGGRQLGGQAQARTPQGRKPVPEARAQPCRHPSRSVLPGDQALLSEKNPAEEPCHRSHPRPEGDCSRGLRGPERPGRLQSHLQGPAALQAQDFAVATSGKPGHITDPDLEVCILTLIGMPTSLSGLYLGPAEPSATSGQIQSQPEMVFDRRCLAAASP